MTISGRTPPPPKFEPIPLQSTDEHHCRCPICGHLVDELDLEEVLQHLEPGHEAPIKTSASGGSPCAALSKLAVLCVAVAEPLALDA